MLKLEIVSPYDAAMLLEHDGEKVVISIFLTKNFGNAKVNIVGNFNLFFYGKEFKLFFL